MRVARPLAESAEDAVVDAAHPGVALVGLPALHFLRAGDDRAQGHFALVGDAVVLFAGVDGIDVLAVDAGGDQHLVAGAGDLGGVIKHFATGVCGLYAFACIF